MAHWSRTLAAAVALVCAAAGAETKAAKSAFDKATLEIYLRHLNLWGPQVSVEINDPVPSPTLPGFSDVRVKAASGPRSIEAAYLVSADGRKILQANVYDIEWNPFREDLAKLSTDGDPSMGTPGATVVLVLFSDFQCSFCRDEAIMLRQNLLKAFPTQVRLYFKDYPLETIHPWAKAAAEMGRCVFRANAPAFWDFHDWIFDKQADINGENLKTQVMTWASEQKLDTLQLNQCIDTHATAAKVDSSIALARELRLGSTPMMFVNGRRVPGKVEFETLKNLIDTEIAYQKTAKNAGEDCGCEVALPAAAGAPVAPKPLIPEPKN